MLSVSNSMNRSFFQQIYFILMLGIFARDVPKVSSLNGLTFDCKVRDGGEKVTFFREQYFSSCIGLLDHMVGKKKLSKFFLHTNNDCFQK